MRDSRPTVRDSRGGVSLLDLAVRFIRWNQANRAHGTWRTYRDGLKHITRVHSSKLAGELTIADVEAVKSAMIDKGYAARTINIMVGGVKRLYRWAVKQGLLSADPVVGLERVSKHVNAPASPRDKHLPLEHALECIKTCRESPPLGDLCKILLLTGVRVGKIVGATWGDVDLEQRVLRLSRHETSGNENTPPRTIPLCERALEILAEQAPDDVTPETFLCRRSRSQPFTVSSLHCRLQRLRKGRAGLDDFGFHRLPHTCATYLARLKAPERVAQAILGHSSTLMTRYYTATDKDEMIEAVEQLSQRVDELSEDAAQPAE